MKTKNPNSLLVTLMLYITGCFMFACTPDKEIENIGPSSNTSNYAQSGGGGSGCENCYESPIIKGSGGSQVILGSLRVCQVGNELCFTYTANNGRRINSIDIGFWPSLASITGDNVNPSPNNFQLNFSNYNGPICVPISQIAGYVGISNLNGRQIVIATNAQFTGAAGGYPGGQGWVGTLVDNRRYPFDRYFTFTFCPEQREKDKKKKKRHYSKK